LCWCWLEPDSSVFGLGEKHASRPELGGSEAVDLHV
jgi:hypothetical protein